MNFREQIWCVVSQEMSFETFTSIRSHVTETEKKKNGKNAKFEILQLFE